MRRTVPEAPRLWIQVSGATSSHILEGGRKPGVGFYRTSYGFPVQIIIPPFLNFDISPLHEPG
jgi:hypothetical protein